MTSFNYLRSVRPSLPLKTTLCGAAMLVAIVVLSSHVLSLRRENQQCVQASRASATGTDRRSGVMRPLTFASQSRNALASRRKTNRKLFNAVAGHRWRQNRLPDNSAAAQQREPAAAPSVAAVSHLTGTVRASVLAIITGSRSSALLSLRGTTRIVSVGDFVDGVRVTAIGENEVSFNDHQTLTLPGTGK